MFAPQHNGLTVVGQIVLAVILTLLLAAAGAAQPGGSESSSKPWWEQQKIRFFWGQWQHQGEAGVPMEQTMANLARVGATVFVKAGPGFDLEEARLAHKYGMRYFGNLYVFGLTVFAQEMKSPVRMSIGPSGNPYGEMGPHSGDPNTKHPCPLYQPVYAEWFLKPALEAAQTGLVDGMHMDWEYYNGRGEAAVCYCDDCFAAFLRRKNIQVEEEVPKAERYQWLEKRDLVGDYVQVFRERRTEMFADFARRIRQAKPDFIFSGYHMFTTTMYDPTDTGGDCPISRGLHSSQAPFFFIDPCHYFEDHTRPWWESHQAHLQKLGFRRIAGTWDNSFFGGQPESDVSASQWMYDAAINSDGYWLWLEEELTPAVWRSLWIANRRIRATEAQVGQFLLDGNQDAHFVTAVEWSGNPELDRKIIQRTYHLGGEYLVHLHNVDTDRPLRLRLRFPRLQAESRWVVTDPLTDLTYAHDEGNVTWTGQELRDGIGLCLEKRSELFVKLAAAQGALTSRPVASIASDEARPMPSHADAAASAARPEGPASGPVTGPAVGRLVCTVTETLGYLGAQGGWAIGNAIHTIDVDGTNHHRLRQLKGYLWSPAWSPDGSRIAFTHYANGRGQIYVMNGDGSGAVNLSANGFCDRSPVWSPDGTAIAFVSDRDGDWEIFVMDADGSGQRQLTHSPGWDGSPVWSPDGRQIAFETNRDEDMDIDIYVMSANGLGQRPVIQRPGDQREPAWSPDGRRLACVGVDKWAEELLVADVDNGEVRQVMMIPWVSCLRWSPDGQRLAGTFRSWEQDTAGIFVIDPDASYGTFYPGSDEQVLVVAEAMRPYSSDTRERRRKPEPTWYSSGSASPRWVVKTFGGLCWSPDGSRLAFSSDMAEDGYFYVYVVAADGEEPVRLEETASAWLQQVSWSSQ